MDSIRSATATVNSWNAFLEGGVKYTKEDKFKVKKGLKDQSLPFMIEFSSVSGDKVCFIFPRSVDSWSTTYTPRTSVVYTQAGIHVDNIGMPPPKISLQGVFGYYGDTVKNGNDGATLLHGLESLVQAFYLQFAKFDYKQILIANGTSAYNDISGDAIVPHKIKPVKSHHDTYINLYDFVTERHWQVVIDSCTFSRSKDRRMLYSYNINMTALSDATAMAVALKKRLEEKQKEKEGEKNWFTNFLDKLREFRKAIQDIRNFVNSIKALVANILGIFNDIENTIKSAISLIDDFVGVGKSILDLPNSIATSLIDCGNSLTRSLLNIKEQFGDKLPDEYIATSREITRSGYGLSAYTLANGVSAQTESMKSSARVATTQTNTPVNTTISAKQETANAILGKASGASTSEIVTTKLSEKSKKAGFVAGAKHPELDTFVSETPVKPTVIASHSITDRDTIYSIASKYNVNWKDIVEANDLEYPYITPSGAVPTPKTMSCGNRIGVPGVRPSSDIESAASLEASIFGIDEDLDEYGDNIEYCKDIKASWGIKNLVSQLKHRMNTRRGELAELGHPEYGSDVPLYLGYINIPVWQKRILLECDMAVLQDPRVASVSGSTMVTSGTAIYYKTNVTLTESKLSMTVEVPFTL